ncbi:MAG: tRNA 2-thiouridine(34) synthase MnmA [Proteobacteria bacterium]|nr:tRNA 2-thiouridine(34) synthase MnmA [Pseudomonadota bacterium]
MSRGRVIVGLSGGVDSAVAALLLREAGWEVQGLFMTNWDDTDAYCSAAQDFQDARTVARELSIPLHRANFAPQYRSQVFEHFLAQLRAGRTPNPDVLCNREIKFGVALQWARRLGAGRFATGHYARLIPLEHGQPAPAAAITTGVGLYKARDGAKDQSYFLHAVAPGELAATLMPLGELHKDEVRERARRAGLPVFDKPDSTGICFIGERPFRAFLSRFLPGEPGPIESPEGEILGTHGGLAFYTLGQRGGLHIGGRAGHAQQPWYVAAKDARRNALIVVQGHEHPLLYSSELHAVDWHWLVPVCTREFRCTVRVRYRQDDQPAQARVMADGTLRVFFDAPQRAVTPGQYAVAYEGERCLGGGVIDSVASAMQQAPRVPDIMGGSQRRHA